MALLGIFAWRAALVAALVSLFAASGRSEGEVSRIAFGSCLNQDLPAPIWEAIDATDPQLWIWLGDNIYGDTDDPQALAAAYGKVKRDAGYARLLDGARALGTWDDHDYGKNNGGKEWRGKEAAKAALLAFLDEPADSPRRTREGVYGSYEFGSGDRKVKVLLIDVRWFRDDPDAEGGDLFGEAQRTWIREELSENDAALTIIASGTQVIPEEHRYEKWAQFPEAREWFFDQLAESGSGAVLFISGDRHIGEFSRLELPGRERAVFEATSSSLTHSWEKFPGEPNRHRIGEVVTRNNFGLVVIDWEAREFRVTLRGEDGAMLLERTLQL